MQPKICYVCKSIPIVTTTKKDGKDLQIISCNCGKEKEYMFLGFDKETAINNYNRIVPNEDDIKITIIIQNDLSFGIEFATNVPDWKDRVKKTQKNIFNYLENLE